LVDGSGFPLERMEHVEEIRVGITKRKLLPLLQRIGGC